MKIAFPQGKMTTNLEPNSLTARTKRMKTPTEEMLKEKLKANIENTKHSTVAFFKPLLNDQDATSVRSSAKLSILK